MKKEKFCDLFYIFFLGSILGWFVEGLFSLIKKGILINHSALVIGPFNIVYGIGAVFLTLLLYKSTNSKLWKIFIVTLISGTILEYILSIGMEFLVGFTAWDYSDKFMNINGRVCIQYSIYWGFLGIIWIKLCYPLINKILRKFSYKKKKNILVILIIFMFLNTLLTFSAINRAMECEIGVAAKNSYELFLDKTFNKAYLKNMFNNRWK